MKQYKAVIYGASAKGIGIAAQLPDQVLVVEKTSLAAREFAGALVMGEGRWEEKTEPGKKLTERYRQKGILMEGRPIQIAAAAPVMFETIRDAKIQVLFGTDIKVSRTDGKHIVTCCNDSGVFQVCAEQSMTGSRKPRHSRSTGNTSMQCFTVKTRSRRLPGKTAAEESGCWNMHIRI